MHNPEAIAGRHHPWHYSNLSLTIKARLRGCRGSNYSLQRNLGTQLLKFICWICEITSSTLQGEKNGSKVSERETFQCSNPFVNTACSLPPAVMFNMHYDFPRLNWAVSLKVKPIYFLQICPSFWVFMSLLNAHKTEFWARGWHLYMYIRWYPGKPFRLSYNTTKINNV